MSALLGPGREQPGVAAGTPREIRDTDAAVEFLRLRSGRQIEKRRQDSHPPMDLVAGAAESLSQVLG
jgi:hypothetical protein